MKKIIGIIAVLGLVSFVLLININAKSKSMKSLEIGKSTPDFALPDPEGKIHKLSDYKGKYVVLEWTNYGCPYVKKHYDTSNMQKLQRKIKSMDIVWLSICSSAKGRQGYMSSSEWKESMMEKNVASRAVLLDPKGDVGRDYGAKTTPHMYVLNPEGNLIYQGAIDDKPTADREDVKNANNFVLAALEQAKKGIPVKTSQTNPYGCSVKY